VVESLRSLIAGDRLFDFRRADCLPHCLTPQCVEICLRCIELGLAHMRRLVAKCYLLGDPPLTDQRKAFQINSELADEDDPIGIAATAYCLEDGLGCEKDERKAFELYLRSARQNEPNSRYHVGRCYVSGTGVAKDVKKAFETFSALAIDGEK